MLYISDWPPTPNSVVSVSRKVYTITPTLVLMTSFTRRKDRDESKERDILIERVIMGLAKSWHLRPTAEHWAELPKSFGEWESENIRKEVKTMMGTPTERVYLS